MSPLHCLLRARLVSLSIYLSIYHTWPPGARADPTPEQLVQLWFNHVCRGLPGRSHTAPPMEARLKFANTKTAPKHPQGCNDERVTQTKARTNEPNAACTRILSKRRWTVYLRTANECSSRRNATLMPPHVFVWRNRLFNKEDSTRKGGTVQVRTSERIIRAE